MSHSPSMSVQCRWIVSPRPRSSLGAQGRFASNDSCSSMPSAASAASIGCTSPAASCASTRCIAVSCAWRRDQKPTFAGGAHVQHGSSGERAHSVSTSSVAPSRTHAGRALWSAGAAIPESRRAHELGGRRTVAVERSPTMHDPDVLEQIGHHPLGARRDGGVETRGARPRRRARWRRPDRVDVVAVSHAASLRVAHHVGHGLHELGSVVVGLVHERCSPATARECRRARGRAARRARQRRGSPGRATAPTPTRGAPPASGRGSARADRWARS